jgi:pimeloyl-ACP methyl ester carboxylesterase
LAAQREAGRRGTFETSAARRPTGGPCKLPGPAWTITGLLLARRIRGARLHVVEGGRHLFILERSSEIAELVIRFLDQATPAIGRPQPPTTA